MGSRSDIVFPVNMADTTAFDSLFRVYYAPLCHFAEHNLPTNLDAEDVIEDLFFKLWERHQVLESPAHARALLYRSARNACLNFMKHGKVAERGEQLLVSELEQMEEDHLQQMIRSEVWGEIYRAIENLPSQCSKVITMSYIEGKTNSEIAGELNLSGQTVKNYKQRGLRILKDNLPGNLFVLLLLYKYMN